MATQVIYFDSFPDCDSVKLFSPGSDTVVAVGSSISMGENDPSSGTCVVTDVSAGTYRVVCFSGNTPLSFQFVTLTADASEFYCRGTLAALPENFSSLQIDAEGIVAANATAVVDTQTIRVAIGLEEGQRVATPEDIEQTLSGGGSVPVNHDYPTTDNLRVLDNANAPVEGALLFAYTAVNWNSGHRGENDSTARSITGPDGRWQGIMMLNPGNYVLLVYKPGELQAKTVSLTVASP